MELLLGERLRREKEGWPDHPSQHGDLQALADEQAGAALQLHAVLQLLEGEQDLGIMDWGGPAAQIGEEPEVGGQVPDQNSGGPGQPEEKEKLDRGAGRGLLGRWKVGGGLAGGSGAVGGGSRCLERGQAAGAARWAAGWRRQGRGPGSGHGFAGQAEVRRGRPGAGRGAARPSTASARRTGRGWTGRPGPAGTQRRSRPGSAPSE